VDPPFTEDTSNAHLLDSHVVELPQLPFHSSVVTTQPPSVTPPLETAKPSPRTVSVLAIVNVEIHLKIPSNFLEAFTTASDLLALTIQTSHQELLALPTLTVSLAFALTVPVSELPSEETVFLL